MIKSRFPHLLTHSLLPAALAAVCNTRNEAAFIEILGESLSDSLAHNVYIYTHYISFIVHTNVHTHTHIALLSGESESNRLLLVVSPFGRKRKKAEKERN